LTFEDEICSCMVVGCTIFWLNSVMFGITKKIVLLVKCQDHRGWWTEDQTADLGHSWPGTLQGGDTQLLSWCCWCSHGVWHYQVEVLCLVYSRWRSGVAKYGIRLAMICCSLHSGWI